MSLMSNAKRIKLTFDVPEHTRRAIASYAGLEGLTTGEAIERLVDAHLPDHVERAKAAIAKGDAPPSAGRRPKRD